MTGFGAKLEMLDRPSGGNRDPNGNADRPGNKAGGSYADRSGGTARQGQGQGGGQSQSSQRQLDDEIPF
ncbi:MAG: hypothetical protein E5W41_03845 [Mesorhizobium sp.]|nr:MAG: hypothetical protein E5W41_03845 [Mesorhizobium sp.]